jgi:hypothetical protein
LAPDRFLPAGIRTAISRCSASHSIRAKPSLRLLVLHDDAEREFAYTSGAEHALKKAHTSGWTVVSMRDDLAAVFAAGA